MYLFVARGLLQAEQAAEEERANVNELLHVLKEKEMECTQLRYSLRYKKGGGNKPRSRRALRRDITIVDDKAEHTDNTCILWCTVFFYCHTHNDAVIIHRIPTLEATVHVCLCWNAHATAGSSWPRLLANPQQQERSEENINCSRSEMDREVRAAAVWRASLPTVVEALGLL